MFLPFWGFALRGTLPTSHRTYDYALYTCIGIITRIGHQERPHTYIILVWLSYMYMYTVHTSTKYLAWLTLWSSPFSAYKPKRIACTTAHTSQNTFSPRGNMYTMYMHPSVSPTGTHRWIYTSNKPWLPLVCSCMYICSASALEMNKIMSCRAFTSSTGISSETYIPQIRKWIITPFSTTPPLCETPSKDYKASSVFKEHFYKTVVESVILLNRPFHARLKYFDGCCNCTQHHIWVHSCTMLGYFCTAVNGKCSLLWLPHCTVCFNTAKACEHKLKSEKVDYLGDRNPS